MLRTFTIAVPLVLVPLAFAPAAEASAAAEAQSRDGRRCEQNQSRRRGGGIVGSFARGALGRIGGGGAAAILSPVGSLLGDAIMNLLDCEEQRQAANATEEAVRGDVGTTSTWTSQTRANVSGSSTVTAAEPGPSDSRQCLTVTDVVIIDGEETRAPKRMCKTPPSNRYVRV